MQQNLQIAVRVENPFQPNASASAQKSAADGENGGGEGEGGREGEGERERGGVREGEAGEDETANGPKALLPLQVVSFDCFIHKICSAGLYLAYSNKNL